MAITNAVNGLVAGAPGALDTLKEIADQLASDESAASALMTLVAAIRNLTDTTLKNNLTATFSSFGTDLNAFVATLPAGALYTYTLVDSTGLLIDIYTGKKAV